MGKKSTWIDQVIYRITEKPSCYKEVEHPPKTVIEKLLNSQKARQEQYNKWSKAHQIYSGSYLPYRSDELIKQGWIRETNPNNRTRFNEEYIRKSTGQAVLRHGRHKNAFGNFQNTHYHWKNPEADTMPKRQRYEKRYLDKYGNVCARKSNESHIKPYKTRRKKK